MGIGPPPIEGVDIWRPCKLRILPGPIVLRVGLDGIRLTASYMLVAEVIEFDREGGADPWRILADTLRELFSMPAYLPEDSESIVRSARSSC